MKTKLAVVMASIMLLVAGCAPQEMDGRYDALAPQAAPSSLIQAGLDDSAFAMDCPVGEEDDGNGGCVPCRDYEGCFTKSADMHHFFALIVELIRGILSGHLSIDARCRCVALCHARRVRSGRLYGRFRAPGRFHR